MTTKNVKKSQHLVTSSLEVDALRSMSDHVSGSSAPETDATPRNPKSNTDMKTSTRNTAIAIAFLTLFAGHTASGQTSRFEAVSRSGAHATASKIVDSQLPIHAGMPAVATRMGQFTLPARASHLEVGGVVVVDYIVSERGRVVKTNVLRNPGLDMDWEVLRVLRSARFEPVTDAAGQPVRARFILTVDFRADGSVAANLVQ